MQKKKKGPGCCILHLHIAVVLSFFCFAAISAAQENVQGDRLINLLSGYLENDLELQKLSLQAASSSLDLSSTKINNGISLTLSTGSITIRPSSDGTTVSFEPEASLSLPQLNDTDITVDFPVTKTEEDTTITNGSVEVSTAIISNARKERKVNLLKAERSLLEAKRSVQNRALSAETDFYTQLKSLYSSALSVLEAKSDFYEDSISLKKLQVQGYGETSSTYRSAALDVQSDRRKIEKLERIFERETAIFARKCGMEYERNGKEIHHRDGTINENETAYQSAIAFLPFSIPEVEPVDVLSFSADNYTDLESATWNKYIATLSREADGDVTLKATGGYTFNNSSADSDTLDGGLSLSWRGVSAKAGVSLPTGSYALGSDLSGGLEPSSQKDPVYTLAFGLTPNTWRLRSIEKKQDEIDRQLEAIDIKSAVDDYETDVLDRESTLNDLIWSKKSCAEEYDMYLKLETDMKDWFNQGIVTESDYLDTRNSRDKAQINQLINLVELIIYNNETKLLFNRDEDLK